MTQRVTCFLALSILALLASCGPAPSGERKPRFGFVINVSGARFWEIAHAGCLQAAEEEGVLVDFQVPGESSAAQQKQIVETLISKGIQGLAITPLNPDSLSRVIDEASTTMPVVCQDSDAPRSQRICYIGTDNVAAGRAAGEAMKRALPEGGEIALFVGQLDVGNARERQQGVLEVFSGTDWYVVGTFTDGGDRPTARANVADALAKYPDLKGIIGLWGYNGPQAAKALEDSPGRDVKIVAADDDVDTLAAIRAGKIVTSIAQQPYEFGYRSIKMLARLVRREPVDIPADKCIFVPTILVDRQNVEAVERAAGEKIALLKRYLSQ
jgi:ribose transport system substrate-binding protein